MTICQAGVAPLLNSDATATMDEIIRAPHARTVEIAQSCPPLKHGLAVHLKQGNRGTPYYPVRLISATVTNSCPIDLKIEPLTYHEHIYTTPMSFFVIWMIYLAFGWVLSGRLGSGWVLAGFWDNPAETQPGRWVAG